ncbi:MAG TPA: acyl-CoA dehydrogenase family protein, partial [Candidatus Binataceae bacterium]|nr:acyl-CoA dehydrogenase family protein [Candidatus Binataceae bacterium]
MNDFFQDGPVLGNQYDEDRVLRAFLRWKFPPGLLAEIEPGLRRLGERAVTDILTLGNAAEAQPPRHVPYDPWGRRIDRIEVCDAWKQLESIAAEEGIVATAYERQHGPLSRLHQFARLYLYGPSSAIATCPLAMTDGAARVLELYGDAWLKANPLPRLTARDPAMFWTSGQWMTERTGGSDISGTSTVARLEDGGFRLYGTKWFTSATTSPVAMTLARLDGAPAGSRGLSLFYLELRDEADRLRNIRVHRLKDKLGTRALPTAELTLEGTPARLVGGEGHGVRKMAALLNITRGYNACGAVGGMRRGLALARDYARKRRVFGKLLAEQPLHL